VSSKWLGKWLTSWWSPSRMLFSGLKICLMLFGDAQYTFQEEPGNSSSAARALRTVADVGVEQSVSPFRLSCFELSVIVAWQLSTHCPHQPRRSKLVSRTDFS